MISDRSGLGFCMLLALKLTNSKEVAHLNFQKDTTALLTGREQDEGPNLSFRIFVKKCYKKRVQDHITLQKKFFDLLKKEFSRKIQHSNKKKSGFLCNEKALETAKVQGDPNQNFHFQNDYNSETKHF